MSIDRSGVGKGDVNDAGQGSTQLDRLHKRHRDDMH